MNFCCVIPLTNTESIKYLGIHIPSNLDFSTLALNKFQKASSCVYSLLYLGLTPNRVNPKLKTFIYKTYCFSKFKYALETTTLTQKILNTLNIIQNLLIRHIFGLNKFSHVSDILKSMPPDIFCPVDTD